MLLAIDPGSAKTGVAWMDEDGRCLSKSVIRTADLETELGKFWDERQPRVIVLGNGTHHQDMQARLEQFLQKRKKSISIALVDECHTTEMGVARWKQEHPPKGWARLLPSGLRSPGEPVDDYVAWILGEIYIKGEKNK